MRHKKIIVVGLLVVVIVAAGFCFVTVNIGNWLKGNDVAVRSQAIIILSGPPTRSLYAADLFHQGYAREVYIVRPIREQPLKMLDDLGVYVPRAEVVYRDVLLKKGVKEKSIHFLGDACMSTVDEANSANRAFRGKDCSVLIVTSPYHVKRTQMIFKERMQNCKFRVLGTPYERFPKKWWTDQDSARNTILEVLKIIFYKAGGKFESSENVRGKE